MNDKRLSPTELVTMNDKRLSPTELVTMNDPLAAPLCLRQATHQHLALFVPSKAHDLLLYFVCASTANGQTKIGLTHYIINQRFIM